MGALALELAAVGSAPAMPTVLIALLATLLRARTSGSSAARRQLLRLPYDPAPAAPPFVINVQRSYGAITFETLRAAYAAGAKALDEHDSVSVRIGPGVHVVNMTGDLFEVDTVQASREQAVEGAACAAKAAKCDTSCARCRSSKRRIHDSVSGRQE